MMGNIDYNKYCVEIDYEKTAAQYKAEMEGGICLYEMQIPLVIECLIEEGTKKDIIGIAQIERLYDRDIAPLLRSYEVCKKIAIGNEILWRFPDSKRKAKRFSDGISRRGIQGVKFKENGASPSDVIRVFLRLFNEKLDQYEKRRQIKNLKIRDNKLEYYRESREKKEAEKSLEERMRKKTPYEIHGKCPGEDKYFSAFDYIRKRPLRGWDSPEKRAWFEKIMGEIIKPSES